MNRFKLNLVVLLILSVILVFEKAASELVVNVRNKGGDIEETIVANTVDDTITLDFQMSDGTLITQFIDFKSEIQIFKALVLGEEERGQSQYQTMCFVVRFIKNEFISSDAMSKLRQKNPGAIRNPEEDKGQARYNLDLSIDLDRSSIISPHLFNVCQEAKESTYMMEKDIDLLAMSVISGPKPRNKMMAATRKFSVEEQPSCKDVHKPSKPCSCHYEVCVGWYPCGLKYCKGKDSAGKQVNYRCGIKTCRKCRLFEYQVKAKQQCLWDETV